MNITDYFSAGKSDLVCWVQILMAKFAISEFEALRLLLSKINWREHPLECIELSEGGCDE